MKKTGVLKNLASLGALQIANYVFPLIAIPIVSRIIGPKNFGIINYAAAFMAYFNLLISFGFDYTATRRIAVKPHDQALRNTVFSEVFFSKLLLVSVSSLVFIVCVFLVPPLANEKRIAFFSFLYSISMLFMPTWLFQGMQSLPKLAFVTFLSKLVFTVTVLFVVKQPEDYSWLPLITGITQIGMSVAAFIWAYKLYQVSLLTVSLKRILGLLWQEKMIFLSLVVISLYTTTNVVILGIFQNNEQVGYYTAAQKLIDVASTVINFPLAQTLFPFIGFAFNEDFKKGIELTKRLLPLIVLFAAAFALILFFIGPIVLLWFYGERFAPSVPVFKILAFVPLIVSVNNIFCIQVMLNLKMDKEFFLVTVGGAIVGLTLNLCMVKFTGYIGTAWNWLIVETVITLCAYIILRFRNIDLVNLNQFKPSSIFIQIQSFLINRSDKEN